METDEKIATALGALAHTIASDHPEAFGEKVIVQLENINRALERLADCVREDENGNSYFCISPDTE